jgi:hypothetical protein
MFENHIFASIPSGNNLLYNNYDSDEHATAVAATVTVAAKLRALDAARATQKLWFQSTDER